MLLRKIKRFANKICGTKTNELYWRFRHLIDKSWAEHYISKKSINHSHRELIIDKISAYYPFESVLEIGCASGPNLYLLAKRFPETKFYGIDISKKAIEVGKKYFKKEKIKNVSLNTGRAEELEEFNDKSVDIVFTRATLIYEGLDKIELVIKQMLRVAKKAIILCEQHNDSSTSFYNDNWIYNYKNLFSKFLPEEKIKLTKIDSKIWSGVWGELGYIIEISL